MANRAPATPHNRFRVGARLGHGMTGSVHHAVDRDGLEVALKFLYSDDASVRAYFLSEATLLRQAQGRRHPHLAEYVASQTIKEPFSLATRFVPGSRELTDLLRLPLAPSHVLRIVEQLASALDYLHFGHPSGPVIHRDVKPPNILIDPAGNALLIDLGAACHPGFRPARDCGFGTLPYMPPEQYDGAEQPQTDQFALAMTCFQMLTGRAFLPNNASKAQRMLEGLRDSDYRALRDGLQSLPHTAEVLARATAYAWHRRYHTCEEFAHELALALAADGALASPRRTWPSLLRRIPWGYVGMAGAAILALLLLLSL